MEKDPLTQTSQHEHGAYAQTNIPAHDAMPALPPPPFNLTASGPGGAVGGGGDTLTTKAATPATSGATSGAASKPAYSAPNAILGELSTAGASLETAQQDEPHATTGGPEVSARMAVTDQRRVLVYAAAFIQVGEETGLPPALLAAIASRESRGGLHLDANGYGLSDPDGYGIMQVDIGSHRVADQDGPGGVAHIRQAAGVLGDMLVGIQNKFPDWTPAMQLRGAVAAYNFNVPNVQTWEGMDIATTGDDYSADIWERARYYASLPDFGGDGAIVEAAAKAGAQGRPALRKGRLIAQSVGKGGVNHEEDAARVLARLRELKVITEAEAADCSADALGAYIMRYQSKVNDGNPDGLMEPGRKTEDRMIAGVVTRSGKPAGEQGGKGKEAKKQAKSPSSPEGKALEEYRRILRETPATEAGAEEILARGDTFAAQAMADLARMGRFDMLKALQEEVWPHDRDWLADSITTRLSDAELAGLPKDFLAKLYEALDAGITTDGEYALMDKLQKAMGGTTTAKAGGKVPGGKTESKTGAADSPKQPRSTKGLYVVSAADAFLRDDKMEPMPGKVLTRWSDVTVTKEKTHAGKAYAYAKAVDGSAEGWTAKSNLYSLDWSAKDHEQEYRGYCDGYYEMMAANDPEITRKDLIKSGTGAKDVIDRYYPNYTNPDGLYEGGGEFRTQAKDMLSFWEANGITYEIESAVRHPLRSTVFNYAVAIADSASADKVEEANAVCRKYGIPIDWAHRKADGTIDTAKSSSQARLVAKEFGLVGIAAKGVTDFGGTVSNHNKGQALDVKLTFSKTVKIEYDGDIYEISPLREKGSKIPNVESTPLSLLCKKKFQITRALPNDAIHWSLTGR